jgi:hypothetical protein
MSIKPSWIDYLPQAKAIVARTSQGLGPNAQRFRCEVQPANPADAKDPNKAAPGSIDALLGGNPELQDYIQNLTRKAAETAAASAAEKERGLVANRDALLAEKKLEKERAEKAEGELASFRKKEEEAALKAKGVHNPEDFDRLVDEAATRKFKSREKELEALDQTQKSKIDELGRDIEKMSKEKKRLWIANHLLEAQLTESTRQVKPGRAWEAFLDAVEPLIVEADVQGHGVLPRIKSNNVLLPAPGGKEFRTPDGLMDPRGFYAAIRSQSDPALKDLEFFLISNGSGSGPSQTPGSSGAPGKAWKDMAPKERTEYINTYGKAAAHQLMMKE